jgi:hypothetical protein
VGIMARKSIPSRKQPTRKDSDKALRKFIFQQMVSIEGGGGKGYGADLLVNMELIYRWISHGGAVAVEVAKDNRAKLNVVVDNRKS